MAATTRPPFRADHVGSLLRPPELHAAREDAKAGRITPQQLRAAEDKAIREAVAMQEAIGLKGVTDGEFRRAFWHVDFLTGFEGIEATGGQYAVTFKGEHGEVTGTSSMLGITGKVRRTRPIMVDHFAFLKSVVTKGVAKQTIPAPSMMHYRGGRNIIDEKLYPDMEQFWDDLGEVYAREVEDLGKLGCTYLQMDDTSLAYLNDPNQREYMSAQGGRPDQHLTYIKAFNAALKRKPAGMTVCTHLCRGNFRSSWVASGGYDYVADALFNQLNVDGYFLEFDDDRSGGFEPLRFVPKGKKVILGLVTSKRAQLEDKDALKRRLEEASRFVPLDQICLSPQCGFSSTVDGNALTWDQQEAKLRLVVEVAREVWG